MIKRGLLISLMCTLHVITLLGMESATSNITQQMSSLSVSTGHKEAAAKVATDIRRINSNIRIIPTSEGMVVLEYSPDFPFDLKNILINYAHGTDKYAFAHELAIALKEDFNVILLGDSAAVQQGHELWHTMFEYAKQQLNKTIIIFVDDYSQRINRTHLSNRRMQDQQGVTFINAFLCQTAERSAKVMFVLITDDENHLDPAVLSRMHEIISL